MANLSKRKTKVYLLKLLLELLHERIRLQQKIDHENFGAFPNVISFPTQSWVDRSHKTNPLYKKIDTLLTNMNCNAMH